MSDAPDFVSPVQGWRLWLGGIREESLRLASVTHDVTWPVGQPLVAQCLHSKRLTARPWRKHMSTHIAPHSSCRCGIYAAGDVFQLAAYLEDESVRSRAFHLIVGRASLWGTVIESERGWRATHAYPSHLYIPLAGGIYDPSAAYIAAQLAEYGVPVHIVTETAVPDLLGSLAACVT